MTDPITGFNDDFYNEDDYNYSERYYLRNTDPNFKRNKAPTVYDVSARPMVGSEGSYALESYYSHASWKFTENNPYGGWITPDGSLIKILKYSGHYDCGVGILTGLGYTAQEIATLGYNGVYIELFKLSYVRVLFTGDITRFELEHNPEFQTEAHAPWFDAAELVIRSFRMPSLYGAYTPTKYNYKQETYLDEEDWDADDLTRYNRHWSRLDAHNNELDAQEAEWAKQEAEYADGLKTSRDELKHLEDMEYMDAQLSLDAEYQAQKNSAFQRLWNKVKG